MKNSKLDKRFFHRLFLLFIILLLPVFVVKEYRIITAKKDTRILPAQDFFQAQLVENNDKSFTLIILTQNNIDVIDENFQSIVSQKYPKYDVVYIDQLSSDGTVERLQELVVQKGLEGKIKVISSEKDYEAFQSYFNTIYALDNERVVVHLSGNDILAHTEVLNLVDQAYTNPDVWMTYGQYLDYYNYQKGIYKPKPQKILCKKRVQRAPWLLASLKTFYAGHFKKIRRNESFEDYFLSLESEASLLLPLAELGKAHVQFIPDVLYIHSSRPQMKKRKMKLSTRAFEMTKSVHESLPLNENGVDVILFSQNRPQKLKRCLESIKGNIQGLGRIAIIYDCDEKAFAAYEKVKESYPEVDFIRQSEFGFKQTFFQTLSQKGGSSYVILSSDHVVVQEEVALTPCIEAMRKSCAYGFYFHLGRQGVEESEGIYSWVIDKAQDVWREPNVLKMTLYRKIDLERDFKDASFTSVNEWIDLWARRDAHHFGLSFEKSKIL